MPLTAGSRLGSCEIVAPIGAGGMGAVDRARDPRLGREVAIKVVTESFADDTTARARFEREAVSIAKLSHPNILSIHEFVVLMGDGIMAQTPAAAGRGAAMRRWLHGRRCPRHDLDHWPLQRHGRAVHRAADVARHRAGG